MGAQVRSFRNRSLLLALIELMRLLDALVAALSVRPCFASDLRVVSLIPSTRISESGGHFAVCPHLYTTVPGLIYVDHLIYVDQALGHDGGIRDANHD
jgi:hypothetical protein